MIMRRILFWLIVLLGAFGTGTTAVFFVVNYSQKQAVSEPALIVERGLPSEIGTINKTAAQSEESPEAKAVRIAEEFVAHNGYTDLPAGKDKIIYETVEFANNFDDLLKFRANTLERKAYGILYRGSGTKIGAKGWTIVFESKNISDSYYKYLSRSTGKQVTRENNPIGRAVTMDENFQNLLMEHKTFPLQNVDKKLE